MHANPPARTRQTLKKNLLAVSISTALLSLATSQAHAQTLAAPSAPAKAQAAAGEGLAVVVITAERREASAQKSALAITVLGGSDLDEKGLVSSKDLVNAVVGLALTTATPNANISLRGVGSGGGNAYADPTVALNIDGVNIGRQFTTTSSFYDLQRVEVLKGPQGTLYGRNATVGALNVIPNRPVFNFAAGAGFELGNYGNVATNGMLNIALSDTVAARLAFKTVKHDGYLSNGYNDAKNQSMRVGLLVKPDKDLSILLSADYFHDGSKGPGTVFLYPNNTQEKWQDPSNPWFSFSLPGCGNIALCPTFGNTTQAPANVLPTIAAKPVVGADGFVNNRQLIVKGELEWKLNDATLTVIPAYVHSKIDFNSYSTGFQQLINNDVEQSSLEARLASRGNGPWRWVGGAFYFHEKQDSTAAFLEARGYTVNRTPNLLDTSRALFGQATYALSEKLRATAGLRFTRESKSQDGTKLLTNFPNPCTPAVIAAGGVIVAPNPQLPGGGCSVPNRGDTAFKSTDFKAGLAYDVSDRSMLYADISTGFKAGGFWEGLAPNSYRPEKLTAYSIGSKNRFLNNRFQANFELFYWNYKDQQINVVTAILPTGFTSRPFNSNGYIAGAEMDLMYLVTSADKLTLDVLAETGKYDYPLSATVLTQPVNNFAIGMPRLNLPHLAFTVGYEHTWNTPNNASVTLSARSHFQSSTYLSALATPGQLGVVTRLEGAAQPAYHTSNLSVTYLEPGEKWQLTGYVDNVENVAVVYTGTTGAISRGLFYRPANTNGMYAALNAPRTYGLRASMKF